MNMAILAVAVLLRPSFPRKRESRWPRPGRLLLDLCRAPRDKFSEKADLANGGLYPECRLHRILPPCGDVRLQATPRQRQSPHIPPSRGPASFEPATAAEGSEA